MRSAFLALTLSASLASIGCGGGGVDGTYVHEKPGDDGRPQSLVLELQSGDKAVASMKRGLEGETLATVTGSYSVDGDKITVSLPGDTDVSTLKDGTLTTEALGETIVFERRK